MMETLVEELAIESFMALNHNPLSDSYRSCCESNRNPDSESNN